MWENWWIRNRLYYLSFKEPIVWFETSTTGETIPVATELRKQVYNVLVKCMTEEKSPVVRATAALALGKFKDKTASGALKDSFKNDKDFDVKNVAALSLGILGEESVINDLKMILNDVQTTNTKFGEISRAYAALAMGYMNNKDTMEALKQFIANNRAPKDKQMQCAALLSLGNLQDKSLVPFIGGVLNDFGRDEFVRAYAALALGRIKDPSALPELKKVLRDQKPNVRASAALALGLIKSPDSKDFSEVTRDAMVQSALQSAEYALKLGLPQEKLVLSVKMSGLQDMVAVYERLAKACDFALHLGLTEAGAWCYAHAFRLSEGTILLLAG